jgi:hypothetical protein
MQITDRPENFYTLRNTAFLAGFLGLRALKLRTQLEILLLGVLAVLATEAQAAASTSVPLNSLVSHQLTANTGASTTTKLILETFASKEPKKRQLVPSTGFNSLSLPSGIHSVTSLNSNAIDPEKDTKPTSVAALSLQPEAHAVTPLDNSSAIDSEKDPKSTSVAAFLQQTRNSRTYSATMLLPVSVRDKTRGETLPSTNDRETQIAAAGPENFNPDLRIPPSPLLPSPPSPLPQKTAPPVFDLEPAPFISFKTMQVDFRNDRDNFGQHNRLIEPTLQFRLGEEEDLFQIKTGFNVFEKRNIETVTNIPLQIGWQTQLDEKKLQVAIGVDLFNRLPTALNLSAQIAIPVSKKLTLFGVLEKGPYKANAQALENQITAWRFGPNLYWQISRNTSFFSSFRYGIYNDSNRERQSFSRLEHKIGQFSVAANLFTWNFQNDVQNEKGYFSPPNFLVFNGELAWEGDIFKFLRCRLIANLGRQRLKASVTQGYTYQARCTVQVSPQLEADLGYSFTNVLNLDTGGSAYNNQSVIGQLRYKF